MTVDTPREGAYYFHIKSEPQGKRGIDMSFVFVSAAQKAEMAAKEAVSDLLAALSAASVPVTKTVMDATASFRISRNEVSAGYGRWAKGDTVTVFAGAPELLVGALDEKCGGWADCFVPTFRDGDGKDRLPNHAQCVVWKFSAAEASAAGVVWGES